MITVTPTQKELFKGFCNKKFDGKVEFIIVTMLNKKPDLLETLITNNMSFNYLGDNDSIVEVVPFGWQTNGNYRNKENMYSNTYIKCINIGLVLEDDITDVNGVMRNLKNKLGELYYKEKIRLVIGDTVHVNETEIENHPIFKKLPEGYIVDITFKYFRELFR